MCSVLYVTKLQITGIGHKGRTVAIFLLNFWPRASSVPVPPGWLSNTVKENSEIHKERLQHLASVSDSSHHDNASSDSTQIG
jgi:hypothetical protein